MVDLENVHFALRVLLLLFEFIKHYYPFSKESISMLFIDSFKFFLHEESEEDRVVK